MSLGHGAKIVTNGIVFAYDMGSKQSWKGKPTTNEFVTGLLNGAYGGDGTIQTGVADAFGKNSPVYRKTGKIRFGNTSGSDEGTLYYGNTYTFSIYMRLTNNHTNTAGFEMDIVDRQTTVWVDGEVITDNIRSHMTYEWRRFSVTATHDNNTNYRFIDIGIYQSTTNEFEWCCPQIELGSFPTPYIPWGDTHQTRSGTESIIDWKGKSTVSPVDLEYTASNTFKFDGIGETDGSPLGSYIPLDTSVTTTHPSDKPDGVTYDIWLRVDTDAPDRMGLLVGSGTINHIEIYSSSKSFRTEAVTQNGYSFGSGAFPDSCRGVWSNFTIVFANNETNRPVRWYQNGNLFYTHPNMGSGTDPNQYFMPNKLGSATGSSSYLYAKSFKGEISVFRVYNKSLTSDEIKINFEALRSRYDN